LKNSKDTQSEKDEAREEIRAQMEEIPLLQSLKVNDTVWDFLDENEDFWDFFY
jgi:hypothetical protein